jgi:anti-sigma factor RsiW
MNEREHNVAALSAADEEIVAYLDGELDAASAARVERRMADDPQYGQRVRDLERAWDALDVLQRAEADEGFTRSTVEVVALRAGQDVRQQKTSVAWRQRVAWGVATALALASTAGGYAWLSTVLSRPNRQLVRDLPVIERVDEYLHADSVEFLQKLQDEGLFAGEIDDAL